MRTAEQCANSPTGTKYRQRTHGCRNAKLPQLDFTTLRLPSELVERKLPVALARIQVVMAQLRGQLGAGIVEQTRGVVRQLMDAAYRCARLDEVAAKYS